jgi:hypothetical protein
MIRTVQVIQRRALRLFDRGGNSINVPVNDGSNIGRMGKWFMAACSPVE